MSTNVTFDGTLYSIPGNNEVGWGTTVSNLLLDIGNNALTIGGTQTITGNKTFSGTLALSGGGKITGFVSAGITDSATTTALTIDASGNVVVVAPGTFTAGTIIQSKNQNAGTALAVSNTTAGNASQAKLTLTSDTAAASLSVQSSTFTPSGNVSVNSTALTTASAGGIVLQASHAAGIVSFASGGTAERMQLSAAGNLGIGKTPVTTLDVNGTINATTLQQGGIGVPTASGSNTFSGTNAFNAAVTMGAALNETRATIASATSTAIGAAAANYLQVTGTTTITSFDTVQAGTRRFLEFAGILTLTHNASTLILPGAANIPTVAGDVATFISEGAGNWRCSGYTRASGSALVASGVASIADATNGGLNFSAATGAVTANLLPSDLLTKAVPIRADSILVMDSAASNAAKTATLTNILQALQPDIIKLSDTFATGTGTQATTSTAFTQLRLQTKDLDTGSNVTGFNGTGSTAANQFALVAGTYFIDAFTMLGYAAAEALLRLRDTTAGTTTLVGLIGASTSATASTMPLRLTGQFVAIALHNYELEVYTTTGYVANAVVSAGFNSGENNVFTIIGLTRRA